MKIIKENRIFSFLVIFISYILAFAVGMFVYKKLSGSFTSTDFSYLNLFIADVAATVFIYLIGMIFKNASIYDPYWSVQPLVIIPIIMVMHNNFSFSAILLLIVVALWGIRLTVNWAYTFKNLNHQDWRYSYLHKKTGKFFFLVSLFGINLFPTTVVFLCMVPAINYIIVGGAVSIFIILGMLISLMGIIFQFLSDIQMQTFRNEVTDKTVIIRIGLWKKSRHPNYFGEILMWFGVAIMNFAIDPSSWYMILGAVINLLMFLFISVPLAEGRLSRYKSDFEKYKEETRMFLPF
ncbi:MAG TPA: DUF1295 domain-containing protein [Acholeplasmataceae bacterium]|nr:DUF1295 domain-containing protein [Acholeplasmataceae bacterium]